MKNIVLVLCVCLASFQNLLATDWQYANYNWDTTRVKQMAISAQEEQEHAVILKNKSSIQYLFNHNGDLESYELIHKIIRINTEAALEHYNKVYIPMYNVIDFLEIKVRVITKSGKVIELNKSNIKEIENLENAGAYKIFAVEGAEKQCEIEYFYKIKSEVSFFGKEVIQGHSQVKEFEFELISPLQLTFDMKVYNGEVAIVKSDTLGKKTQTLSVNAKNIPILEEEEFAFYEANRLRIEYKLAYNGNVKMFSWSEAAQNAFSRIYYWESDKELKPIDKELKKIGVISKMDEKTKIQLIENYIKSNFIVHEDVGNEGYFIETILKNKVASKLGMVRLFAAFYTKAQVVHNIGITSDRSIEKVDRDFVNYNLLTNYVIYFTEENQYLAPTEMNYRYPLIPYLWTNNNVLQIKGFHSNKLKIATGEIEKIEPTPYLLSQHNHEIKISFNPDFDLVNLDVKNIFWGYKAIYYQPYIVLMNEEQKTEFAHKMLKSSAEDGKILTYNFENTDVNTSTTIKPFIISGTFTSSSLIEKAGKKSIFHLGQLIGPQAEMYQNKTRIQEVESDFNRRYFRTISLTIPEGYVLKNPDAINIYHKDAKGSMQFISSYKLEGNELQITVDEYYSQISYPISQIEEYRKVINAAADFNKIKLVFEKK